jgi:hypothetical protein
MAYVPVDSPLPQNSTMPLPADCVARSNAQIARAQQISDVGRMRVYQASPAPGDLLDLGVGVAASATRILPQSELARRSVLTGGTPAAVPPSFRTATPAPRVVPIDWVAGQGAPDDRLCLVLDAGAGRDNTVAAPRVVMPGRAPRFTARPWRVGGMGGYGYSAPQWGDAAGSPAAADQAPAPASGLLGWIRAHPVFSVGLAAVGVAMLTGMEGRR